MPLNVQRNEQILSRRPRVETTLHPHRASSLQILFFSISISCGDSQQVFLMLYEGNWTCLRSSGESSLLRVASRNTRPGRLRFFSDNQKLYLDSNRLRHPFPSKRAFLKSTSCLSQTWSLNRFRNVLLLSVRTSSSVFQGALV